jgi:hypothetical protein
MASAESYRKVRVRSPEKKKGKALVETTIGDEFYRENRRWHIIHRIIDRVKCIYYEHVEDMETRVVIHHCEESLDEHRNHGSAKKKSTSNT